MNIRIEQMKPVLGSTEQNLLKMVESIEKGIEAGDDIIKWIYAGRYSL